MMQNLDMDGADDLSSPPATNKEYAYTPQRYESTPTPNMYDYTLPVARTARHPFGSQRVRTGPSSGWSTAQTYDERVGSETPYDDLEADGVPDRAYGEYRDNRGKGAAGAEEAAPYPEGRKVQYVHVPVPIGSNWMHMMPPYSSMGFPAPVAPRGYPTGATVGGGGGGPGGFVVPQGWKLVPTTEPEKPPEKPRGEPAERPTYGKLFVGGLRHTVVEKDLWNHFKRFGDVVEAVVIRDPVHDVSRGFGFVEFNGALPAGLMDRDHFIQNRKVGVREYAYE
jgi:hypothetical protein